MVKEFIYTSSNGTKQRKVFVIRETDKYLEGRDLNLLSEDDANFITSTYKDFVPFTNKDQKISLEGFNPSWNKAYRNFVKSKIQ